MARPILLGTLLLAACTLQYRNPSGAPQDEHAAHMSAADLVPPPSPQVSGGPPAQQDLRFPASNAAAADRLASSNRHGEWVTIALEAGSSDSVMAWVVYPETREKAPVVVVVHEIFGLSTWVRGVADQVAAEGFIAVAPDLLTRVRGGPSSVEIPGDSARRLISGVNSVERNRMIMAVANWAMTQPAATQKYGIIGYCWGGTTVWMHAVHGGVNGFSGGVAFYGAPYMTQGTPATATEPAVAAGPAADSLAKIRVPVMLLNGSKDARIGAAMPAIDSIMRTFRKSYEGHNYEGAVHGFLRAQADPKAQRDEAEEAANMAAVRDGWPRTVAFLKRHLGA